jgi:levansucrase
MPPQVGTDRQKSTKINAGTSFWTAEHISLLSPSVCLPQTAVITQAQAMPLIPDMELWDIWPVQDDTGNLVDVSGNSLWIMLSAPRSDDPDDRHNIARMRLIQLLENEWIDCGPLLPDGFSPGSREWSGSTRLNTETNQVTLWFTASGRRGDAVPNFEQRLFQTTGTLDLSGATPRIINWSDLHTCVDNDGEYYADLTINQGVPGRIKGFRDPYWFRDPLNGKGYLLFTGSKSAHESGSDYDGVIGIAAAQDADGFVPFKLLPPLIDADGLANELERPHMFVNDGLYYLFWSSQRSIFAPNTTGGLTGLYGMVGPSIFGPFEPLNGTGLVLTNPVSEPRQAYAWQVLPSLEVVSFIDYWGLENRDISHDIKLKAQQFGGTIAPVAKISLHDATSKIIEGGA